MKARALLAALLVFVPVSLGGRSFYVYDAFFCHSADGCRHEIAHRMNSDLGYPARSRSFADALRVYIFAHARAGELDDFTGLIFGQGGMFQYDPAYDLGGWEQFSNPQDELYAAMYEHVDGDVDALPAIFQTFYSRDGKYAELFDCLMRAEVRLCGSALHIEKR